MHWTLLIFASNRKPTPSKSSKRLRRGKNREMRRVQTEPKDSKLKRMDPSPFRSLAALAAMEPTWVCLSIATKTRLLRQPITPLDNLWIRLLVIKEDFRQKMSHIKWQICGVGSRMRYRENTWEVPRKRRPAWWRIGWVAPKISTSRESSWAMKTRLFLSMCPKFRQKAPKRQNPSPEIGLMSKNRRKGKSREIILWVASVELSQLPKRATMLNRWLETKKRTNCACWNTSCPAIVYWAKKRRQNWVAERIAMAFLAPKLLATKLLLTTITSELSKSRIEKCWRTSKKVATKVVKRKIWTIRWKAS